MQLGDYSFNPSPRAKSPKQECTCTIFKKKKRKKKGSKFGWERISRRYEFKEVRDRSIIVAGKSHEALKLAFTLMKMEHHQHHP